jgi:hypothetical protein
MAVTIYESRMSLRASADKSKTPPWLTAYVYRPKPVTASTASPEMTAKGSMQAKQDAFETGLPSNIDSHANQNTDVSHPADLLI